MTTEDELERIIAKVITQFSRSEPATLARALIEELWEAGFDIRIRPDITLDPSSHYLVTDEACEANDPRPPARLFRCLATEPRNALIHDKILELARKFETGVDDCGSRESAH